MTAGTFAFSHLFSSNCLLSWCFVCYLLLFTIELNCFVEVWGWKWGRGRSACIYCVCYRRNTWALFFSTFVSIVVCLLSAHSNFSCCQLELAFLPPSDSLPFFKLSWQHHHHVRLFAPVDVLFLADILLLSSWSVDYVYTCAILSTDDDGGDVCWTCLS